MENKAAKLISIIFHPIILPTLGILILYNSGSVLEFLPFQAKKLILIVVFVSTFILPLTFVPFFIFQKIIKDLHMNNNRERLIPFFITLVLYFFCYYLLRRLGAPQTFTKFILAASSTVTLLFLFSFKWKISAHTIGLGGLIGSLVAISFRLGVNLEYYIISAIIASGLVAYARLKLKTHEQYQIYIGWITGFVTSFIIIHFF